MTADSPILLTCLRVCKIRPTTALPWTRQFSCFIPSLLQGHIVPLHVSCVHLQAAASLKCCQLVRATLCSGPHCYSPSSQFSHADSSCMTSI